MRVAVNGWFLQTPELRATGSGQYTARLLEAIASLAPDVTLEVVMPRRSGDWAKLHFEQVEFPRAARRMNADIAFVPYWGPPLQCDVPLVVTIHDVIPLALPAYRGGALQRAYASLVRAAAANAAAVLTDSEFSKQDILRLLPVEARRVHVVPLAADSSYTPNIEAADRQRAAARYALPESYVLYLGGYDARKNIETLLQVYVWCGESIGEEFPLVLNAEPHTPVVTNSGQRMTLAQMAEALEVSEYVRYIGHVAEEDKPALYAGARAFLYPSTYEGFGLPVLEAMACGTPVVGSNATSIPEVVGNAGMLVDPLDARSMAGALIATCIEDELNERLRQRALLRAAQFTWQRTALETLAVFRRIAQQRHVA
ncbi:MAG: glycosyltransferase family 4 protein [Thermoflexales bacterium]|nr:glycosyltransferase family 4 protein [Thermoflexales bacterium]MCS7324098.1 glycosyltransferase family 4 protein [Thermoflexales bacterium]MDW8054535.1 glycosyltransferase family 1 protein [Anaerolineae bacterium]MDW8292846.1 glycosyltransferase family 1 protein [Anaerolineae bacterium]